MFVVQAASFVQQAWRCGSICFWRLLKFDAAFDTSSLISLVDVGTLRLHSAQLWEMRRCRPGTLLDGTHSLDRQTGSSRRLPTTGPGYDSLLSVLLCCGLWCSATLLGNPELDSTASPRIALRPVLNFDSADSYVRECLADESGHTRQHPGRSGYWSIFTRNSPLAHCFCVFLSLRAFPPFVTWSASLWGGFTFKGTNTTKL